MVAASVTSTFMKSGIGPVMMLACCASKAYKWGIMSWIL